MAKIGFRFASDELPATVEPGQVFDAVDDQEIPEHITRKLILMQVQRKAAQLAINYIMNCDLLAESRLKELIELKRSYKAML